MTEINSPESVDKAISCQFRELPAIDAIQLNPKFYKKNKI